MGGFNGAVSGESPKTNPTPRRTSLWAWGLLLLIILFVGFVRYRLRETPLERDEGEYAYAGQLLLQGIPPYKLAYSMKLPGTLACYALIMAVFGQTIAGIHLGFTLVNAGAIVLIFLIGRRLMDSPAGLVAAATYGLMSVSSSVLGIEAHATHFVNLFALWGMFLLLPAPGRAGGSARWFLSGLLFGLATLMKQPGLFFMMFGFFFLLWPELWSRPFKWMACVRKAVPFICGGILPLLVTMALLQGAGVFDRFWFWTVTCVRMYGTTATWEKAKFDLTSYFEWVEVNWYFWSLGGLGLLCLVLDRKAGRARPFLFGLLVFSVIAVSQGFYFRPHYFVMLLPAIALLGAEALNCVRRLILQFGFPRPLGLVPYGAFLLIVSVVISNQRLYFFVIPAEGASQWLYQGEPFAQAVVIGNFIRDHTAPGDRIVVLGSEPEIYFYSHRHSGTGYLYTYEMMQDNYLASGMRDDMLAEIKATQPEMIIAIRCESSWGCHTDARNPMFSQSVPFWNAHYDTVGAVDLPLHQPTRYLWGADAAAFIPTQSNCVFLLKRRSEKSRTGGG